MSGGSLNYAYRKVQEVADTLKDRHLRERPYNSFDLHAEFIDHLYDVAEALKAIEWMLSFDTSEGDEIPAIKKALNAHD